MYINKVIGVVKMRRFRHMSIEELLDKDEELMINDEEKIGSWGEVIRVKEAIYRIIHADKNHEYRPSLDKIKQDLVSHLVNYGSYLKTEYKKDDNTAEESLKKVLRYDQENQLAHYRLGFIYYKNKKYFAATTHFQTALHLQSSKDDFQHMLNPQQVYYATLYLSNSALHIAKESQESLNGMENNINQMEVSNLELSPLFKILSQREAYLLSHAFKVASQTGEKHCSREECERIIESNVPDQLILHFSSAGHFVFYNDMEVNLSINQAEMLEIFMQESSEENPVTKDKLFDIFSVREDREVPTNTYIQAVRRLKDRLSKCGVPKTVIKNKRYGEETGYYFDQSFSYQVIRRVDDM